MLTTIALIIKLMLLSLQLLAWLGLFALGYAVSKLYNSSTNYLHWKSVSISAYLLVVTYFICEVGLSIVS